MSAPEFKPRRLDVEVFARQRGELSGATPLAEMPRLAASVLDTGSAAPLVNWTVNGRSEAVLGGAPHHWLHLRADVNVDLECQRCLGGVGVKLATDRQFRFVADEAQAASEDLEAEEEVLVLTRSLDLLALLEDELLLELPLVPRHDRCPKPLASPATDMPSAEPQAGPTHRPFAGLEALRAAKSGGGGKK